MVKPQLPDIRATQGCRLLRPCLRPPWRRTGFTPLTATESWPALPLHPARWRMLEHLPHPIVDLPPPAPSLRSLRCPPPLQPAHPPRDGAWQHQAKKRSMCTVPSREILPLTLHLRPPLSLPHPPTVSRSALWPASSRRRTSLGSDLTDPLEIDPQTDTVAPLWVMLDDRVASQNALPRDSQTSRYTTVSKWCS